MFRRLINAAPDRVEISLDGKTVSVPQGISVAAALFYLDAIPNRRTPVSGTPRAPYCMMGVCFDCVMEIDGEANQQACQVIVSRGMQVVRQNGAYDSEVS
jgi:succinate dehydrogenase/fumarate reductase-like Fe-S protein